MALVGGQGIGRAQFGPPGTPSINPARDPKDRGFGDDSYPNREMQQKQLKRLRELHQQEVILDTARMEQLATAMKNEVDRGNKTLNADVMKDADEIGKLAKRVSERIKTQ
jgi:hypothetical protein